MLTYLEVLGVLSQEVGGGLVPGGHPGVGEDLPGGDAAAGVHVQHLADHVLGEAGHGAPVAGVHVVLALADPLQDVIGRVLRPGGERSLPGQHREQQHAQAPHVARRVITLNHDNHDIDIIVA